MNSTPFDLILQQSGLHLVSYGLVLAILFVAVMDSFLIGRLRKALQLECARMRTSTLDRADLRAMVHPVACGLARDGNSIHAVSSGRLRHRIEMAEAALFVPVRARMTLTRDLSTLMGLIATLLALVAAAGDFARHGQPEQLIGSVGTGCLATCVAAIGCAVALWNLSRLTRLRLQVACDTEQVLDVEGEAGELHANGEVPIHHLEADRAAVLNQQLQEAHAPI
jgi:hypothetical protein